MNAFKMILCSFALAVVFAAIGCTDDSGLANVSGTVTIDGEPPDKGSISFIPVDGQGPTTGAEIVDGKYASKAPLGQSKVEIRVPKVVGQQKLYDTPDSPVQDVLEEALPAKYNEESDLRLIAESGNNEKDWNLETE